MHIIDDIWEMDAQDKKMLVIVFVVIALFSTAAVMDIRVQKTEVVRLTKECDLAKICASCDKVSNILGMYRYDTNVTPYNFSIKTKW